MVNEEGTVAAAATGAFGMDSEWTGRKNLVIGEKYAGAWAFLDSSCLLDEQDNLQPECLLMVIYGD